MNRAGYRHLPVVADDKLVGIITDRDLRLAVNSPVVEGGAERAQAHLRNISD
jgi:CBS domain-containing protein